MNVYQCLDKFIIFLFLIYDKKVFFFRPSNHQICVKIKGQFIKIGSFYAVERGYRIPTSNSMTNTNILLA